MKSLPTLIRLKQQELDEYRRLLARLEQEAAAIQERMRELQEEVALESRKVLDSGQPGFGFGDYLISSRRRRTNLEGELREVVERMAPMQDQVAEAYQELKRFELAHQNIEMRAAEESERREQAALDEIGLAGYRRQQGA